MVMVNIKFIIILFIYTTVGPYIYSIEMMVMVYDKNFIKLFWYSLSD